MRQRRKRSAAITLVLVGMVSGCSDGIPQQDVYASLAECERDWRSGCRRVTDNNYPPGFYYGPVHCAEGVLPSLNAMHVIERGGFGCTANRFSSGS